MLVIGEKLQEVILDFLNKPYVNVTSSRTTNTLYTNNKDYPMQIYISLEFVRDGGYRQANIVVNGTSIGTEYLQGEGYANFRDIRTVHLIVPPGGTYEITTPASSGQVNIFRWSET